MIKINTNSLAKIDIKILYAIYLITVVLSMIFAHDAPIIVASLCAIAAIGGFFLRKQIGWFSFINWSFCTIFWYLNFIGTLI